jgi:multidrug resistance efflux pump
MSLATGQLDLINLAISYIDATGNARTARANYERTAKLAGNNNATQTELELHKFALETAERKAQLLRGVTEIALSGAQSDFRYAQELVDQGVAPRSQLSEAKAKLQILELILKSGQ